MRRALTLTFVSSLVLVLGCGGSGPKLVKVSGRVTLDNSPLANATVDFIPATSGGKADLNQRASGQTDAEGHFTLRTTSADREGAAPGKYRVEIHQIDRSQVKPDQRGLTERIPPQYNRNSQLTCDVPEGGKSDANFDLKSR